MMELIRDFQRAWVALPSQYDSSQTTQQGLITNLSVTGAQVRGIAPLQDSTYEITIHVAPGTTLKLCAQNIWVKNDQFGLKFISLTTKDLFLLRALIWAHRREDLE